jgi:hypothetical protein
VRSNLSRRRISTSTIGSIEKFLIYSNESRSLIAKAYMHDGKTLDEALRAAHQSLERDLIDFRKQNIDRVNIALANKGAGSFASQFTTASVSAKEARSDSKKTSNDCAKCAAYRAEITKLHVLALARAKGQPPATRGRGDGRGGRGGRGLPRGTLRGGKAGHDNPPQADGDVQETQAKRVRISEITAPDE